MSHDKHESTVVNDRRTLFRCFMTIHSSINSLNIIRITRWIESIMTHIFSAKSGIKNCTAIVTHECRKRIIIHFLRRIFAKTNFSRLSSGISRRTTRGKEIIIVTPATQSTDIVCNILKIHVLLNFGKRRSKIPLGDEWMTAQMSTTIYGHPTPCHGSGTWHSTNELVGRRLSKTGKCRQSLRNISMKYDILIH